MSRRGHAASAPAKRGRGTTRDSRSELRVVEGAQDSPLHIRFEGPLTSRFCELLRSEIFATITTRHCHPPLPRAAPQPTLRVGVLRKHGGRRPPMPPPPLRGGGRLRRLRRQVWGYTRRV